MTSNIKHIIGFTFSKIYKNEQNQWTYTVSRILSREEQQHKNKMKVLLALFVMITAIEAFFWPFTSGSERSSEVLSTTTTTQRPRTVDPVLERLARVLADHLLLRLSDQKTTTTNSEMINSNNKIQTIHDLDYQTVHQPVHQSVHEPKYQTVQQPVYKSVLRPSYWKM